MQEPEKIHPAELFNEFLQRSPHLKAATISYPADYPILAEGETNDRIFIIVEGTVTLRRSSPTGKQIRIETLGPGRFLGLLSFWSREPAFSNSITDTPVTCISLTRETFDQLFSGDPEFAAIFQKLVFTSMVERYRNVVRLNVEVATLGKALENERNQLRQAIAALEKTRNRLINQEKLATLGQLLAGIAHEINNPSAALARAVDNLNGTLSGLFSARGLFKDFALEARLLQGGQSCPLWGAEEKRLRMQKLEEKYPFLKRSLIRRLAQIPDEILDELKPCLKRLNAKKPGKSDNLDGALLCFEAGFFLRTITLTTDRMNKLVKSLKSYGRQDASLIEEVDLREGLRDTLTVLNNRLKHYALHIDLPEIPLVTCNPGEMNQVWTNILVNACDATEPGGNIYVRCGKAGEDKVFVELFDSGSGIPVDMFKQIFEPNVTTKSAGGGFGLGLGLAISRDIVEKHGGSITASNRSEGGAIFHIELPTGQGE